MDHISSEHGGTEGQLVRLIAGLDRTRYRPRLVLLYGRGSYIYSDRLPCECHCLELKSGRQLRYWTSLAAVTGGMRRARPTLLHTVFPESVTAGPWLARLAGVPHVTWRRDLGYWLTPVKRRLLRIGRRWTACCVVNSEAVRSQVIRDEGYLPAQVAVVRNIIDFSELNDVRPKDVRGELRLPPGTVSLVFPANLRPVKGGDIVLAALAQVRARGAAMHLVSIGENTQLLGAYRARCRELDIASAVTFLGHLARAELLSWVKGCDIALNASYSEGYSNGIIEAMLLGLPVVATAVGGNLEQVVDRHTGFLVPAGDVEAMAEAMFALYQDQERRRAMGAAGVARAKALHGENDTVRQHEALYARLLASPRSTHAR